MNEAERLQLEERIESGRARQLARAQRELAARTASARDKLSETAREHPLLLIGAGLALGAALSTLIPRSPTRKLSKQALGFMTMLAELGMAYGRQAMNSASDGAGEASRTGRAKLGEIGQAMANGVGKLRERAARKEDA